MDGTVDGPAGGLRERKKRATRAALGAAALRLVAERGLEHVTVDQIAAEADIAVRTFRHYFASKEEAAVATAEAGATAFVADFRARPPRESTARALRAALLGLVDRGEFVGPDQIAVLRLVHTTPSLVPQQLALLARQERALAAAIDDRLAAAGERPAPGAAARRAAAVFAVLRVVLGRWLEAAGSDPPAVDDLRRELRDAVDDLAAGLDG